MFIMNAINSASHIEIFSSISAQEIFCCLIEANYNDPSQYEPGVLRQLLREAGSFNNLNSKNAPLPMAFSNSLMTVLNLWKGRGKHQIVFYAGILLNQNSVNITTAGDIRVHLVKDKKLKAVTRLHNMIEDAPDNITDRVRKMPQEFLRSVATRSLGDPSSEPPETTTWNIDGAYSIIICTSQFHKYRSQEDYLPEVSNILSTEVRNRLSSIGAVVKIDCLES